jgi:hypothetical protein
MTGFFATKARAGVFAAFAGLFMLALTGGAAANNWPDVNSNVRDDVTGFLCYTSGCDFLRLPKTKCICKKENPTEQDLRKLKLTCSISQGLSWQACPVLPPFGN